jgi:uncharacterized zinc-type alcohol dehydrogenase-like protein
MTIHAFAAKAPKDPLSPFTYAKPTLAPFEVLIKITHCGLCHTDLHLIDNAWNRTLYPVVPGHEVVGTIVEKGAEAKLSLNTRVGVSWLYSSCLECDTCSTGNTHICPSRKATCIGHHGGFADFITADSRFVYPIPQNLDSALAAPLLCAGATTYAPFRRWKIQAPHRVAIIGVGGLGHVALQFAHAFGCEVTALSSSPSKEKDAKAFGAHHFVLLDEAASKAGSFDFILSTVDGGLDWNLICSLLKPTGVLCVLGRSPTPITVDTLTGLTAEKVIAGSSVASRFIIKEMLQFAADHNITPKIELMKMSEINQAIQKVRDGKARYRIVLTQ